MVLTIVLGLLSCQQNKDENKATATTEYITPDLGLDHFNIWVKDPDKAKALLNDIGFTAVPDSLSNVHHGQGTAGKYFHFLNSYLELIFVHNQRELEENNQKNKALDFTARAIFEENGASPFSIALRIKDYDIEKIPFEKIKYQQDWMEENASIYAAKNSKTHLKEPSVFVVYPGIEADTFATISDLKNIPEAYAFARAFYQHPNGAEKVTNIVITSVNVDLNTETMKTMEKINNVTIKNGDTHLMELFFDNGRQGKDFDLRPALPLIIHL